MLSCKSSSRLVSEAQERSLTRRERLGLRLHLMMCGNCRRFERQIQILRKGVALLIHSEDKEVEDQSLGPEARERIRRAIAEQDTRSR